MAIALGAAGARVFVTGRTEASLIETARLVREAAGAQNGSGADVCRHFVFDHADDDAVSRCFADIAAATGANDGRGLDLLVSNAFSGADTILKNAKDPFWAKGDVTAKPAEYWDAINNVGLKSNYVAIVHAARLMVPRRAGLIVNISSFGGTVSIFDAAYGCGKCANDRLIAEFGRELQGTGVTALTLYPGLVSTEFMVDGPLRAADKAGTDIGSLSAFAWNAESPVYVGRVIAAIASDTDPSVASRRQGQIVIAAEAGNRYGVTDLCGERRYSGRSLRTLLFNIVPGLLNTPVRHLIPDVLVPWFLVGITQGAAPKPVP